MSKSQENGGASSGSAIKAALGVAVVAILVAAFGGVFKGKEDVAPTPEEHMEMVGQKVELQQKVADITKQAQDIQAQREAAEKEREELEKAVAEKQKAAQEPPPEDDGVGPSMMAAQGGLIERLLTMAQEVEELGGDENREERMRVSKRVEGELKDLEEMLEKQNQLTGSAKQQASALIGLVRSALQSDRDGTGMDTEEEWTEEHLLKTHGLVTYASGDYWEEAYAANKYGETFEWYGSWEELDTQGNSIANLVRPLLTADARTLVLGCGNSNMSAVLNQEGIKKILSVDISEAVIQQMKSKYADHPGMEWRVMDVTKMDVEDGSQDLIFDKGLFDALYAGTGTLVAGALTEVSRVLRPGAHFVSISFGGDRLKKLFGTGPEAQASAAAAVLDCQLVADLFYDKNKAAGDSAGKMEGKTYVYVCERK